jgi:hypothetical protein
VNPGAGDGGAGDTELLQRMEEDDDPPVLFESVRAGWAGLWAELLGRAGNSPLSYFFCFCFFFFLCYFLVSIHLFKSGFKFVLQVLNLGYSYNM